MNKRRVISRTNRIPSRHVVALSSLLALAFLAACAPQGETHGAADVGPNLEVDVAVDETCFSSIAEELSSDEYDGRGVGSEGLEKAAQLVARAYKTAGLDPIVPGYRQSFEVTTGVELGDANRLSIGDRVLERGTDYTPLGFSSSSAFEGEVAFVGYGITANEIDYDDYEGIDVDGKIVMAMRFEPGENDDDSPFAGRQPSRWSDLRLKALTARTNGAAALMLFEPPGDETDPDSQLPALRSDGPMSHAGIPVVQITTALAAELLNGELKSIHSAIDSDYTPRSQLLSDVTMSGNTNVVATKATVSNVVGAIPGSGELASEYVVVGAHYDHLGHGGAGSRAPDSTDIHNGADDNASGVAAMLCAVGDLAENGDAEPRRSILAIAFAAEEIGLGGSSWYVANPVVPLEDTLAMVNLDMVGRVRDGKLMALGADSAESWASLIERAATETELELSASGDGYGPSDQMPFYQSKIPVVHLFSGSHDEYHTPADDFPTLDIGASVQVASFTRNLVSELSVHDAPMDWVPPTASASAVMEGDSRGYGSYLGTIPDYSTMTSGEGGGVLLSGVRAGGPADRAGITGGDTIVEMGGVAVQNLYDMTYVLRDHRPGETIEIIVLREGERVPLKATLEKRGAPPSGVSGHGEAGSSGQGGESSQGGGHG